MNDARSLLVTPTVWEGGGGGVCGGGVKGRVCCQGGLIYPQLGTAEVR